MYICNIFIIISIYIYKYTHTYKILPNKMTHTTRPALFFTAHCSHAQPAPKGPTAAWGFSIATMMRAAHCNLGTPRGVLSVDVTAVFKYMAWIIPVPRPPTPPNNQWIGNKVFQLIMKRIFLCNWFFIGKCIGEYVLNFVLVNGEGHQDHTAFGIEMDQNLRFQKG